MAKTFLPTKEDYGDIQDNPIMQNEIENILQNLFVTLIHLECLYGVHGDHAEHHHKQQTLKTRVATMDWGKADVPTLLY